MENPQIHGVKQGVLLLNYRLIVPDEFPEVRRVEQVVVTPVLRSVSWEGDYWRYAGLLQVKATYRSVEAETRHSGMYARDAGLSLNGEKNFYDDGFSDHDEFTEEEFILWDEEPVPEFRGLASEVHVLEQSMEFAGLSPAVSTGLPEADSLVPRVMDVELNVVDERILDISTVLLIEAESNGQIERVRGESLEFRHPLTITSWASGIGEVFEWQVGFKVGESILRDNEVLVSGNLVIQVIGVEQEAGERVFSNVLMESPVYWEIPIPPAIDPSLINCVKVAMHSVQDDSEGLAILGSLFLDIAEEAVPAEQEAIISPITQPEEIISELEESRDSLIPSEESRDNLLPPEEPARPVLTGIDTQDFDLGWLKGWADGESTGTGVGDELPEGHYNPAEANYNPAKVNYNPTETNYNLLETDYNHTVYAAEGVQQILPEGLHSKDIDPDAEELLRSLDLALGQIPTLEEVMAEFSDRNRREEEFQIERVDRLNPEVRPDDFVNSLQTKVQETHLPERKSLTQLKFISREALQGAANPSQNGTGSRFSKPAGEKLPHGEKARISPQKVPERAEPSQANRVSGITSGSKSTGTWTLYRIQPGDSLVEICRRYGIDFQTIKQRNKISGNSLEPGSTIWIPK